MAGCCGCCTSLLYCLNLGGLFKTPLPSTLYASRRLEQVIENDAHKGQDLLRCLMLDWGEITMCCLVGIEAHLMRRFFDVPA